jgi:hypothetical protein
MVVTFGVGGALMDRVQLDRLILNGMPSFIAKKYNTLLETTSVRDRVQLITHIYDLWLRMLTITLVSQYLIHDRETVSDTDLNTLLKTDFEGLTIDGWQDVFFTTLDIYKGKRNLFFMPELYDFYWETSSPPYKARPDVDEPFKRLTKAFLDFRSEDRKKDMPPDESGWEKLAKELEGHLLRILEATLFFTSYDLIRVLESQQGAFTLELYRGTSITTTGEAFPEPASLRKDRFYLRARTSDFLSLHPLLIFWDKEPLESETLPPEVAVYHRFLSEQLQYLLSSSGNLVEFVQDHQYFKGFMQYLIGTIDEVKNKIVEANRLTWRMLSKISSEITDQRMETAKGKYNEKLYLQRQHTLEELLSFLDSDKRCFVLIGRSGVGKSSFLFSFNQYLRDTRQDNTCMLMYDGALLHLETSLETSITQDFNNRLRIAGKKIENIWQEIDKIEGINERRVVLCVDAINESGYATELLKQLDSLVQRASWPWLKVIFSSRPETWQTIRRGVNLDAAKYYRSKGSDSFENTLEPFDYSILVDPFTTQELQLAYEKYEAEFHLKTAFQDIPFAVSEVLREPLNLWLVARTYAESAIPNTIRVTDLVKNYVASGRLKEEDERLLRRRLVPLMVSPGHYDNKITRHEIDLAGGDLYEAIYSKLVNQSFNNLVDASILTHQEIKGEQRTERSIAFKYERFYDYFIGERLADLSASAEQGASQPNRAAYFLDLVQQTAQKAFLWGAIRSALLQVLAQGDAHTIIALCHSDHLRVKELMTDVLTSYGADHPAEVIPLLQQLVPVAEETSNFQLLRQFAGQAGKLPDKRAQNAARIAVEAASNLGITEILQRAGLQSAPSIRAATVRYGYLLWQRDRAAGFAVLDYLGNMATRHFIPNMAAFESALGLSLVIFFDHSDDGDVLQHLQQLWHTVIGHILALNESSNRLSKLLRGFIRERIFSLAITFALRLIKQLPENLPIRHEGFETFFRRGAAEKALYRRLTSYINPEGSYTYEEMKRDFLTALPIMDGIIQPVSCIGLSTHLARHPEVALRLMRELFDAAEKAPPPNLWLTGVAFALTPVLDADPSDDEVFACFFEMMERCQRYYALPGHSAAWIDAEAPPAIFLGQCIYYQYQREQHQRKNLVPPDWLKSRIEAALEQKNEKFFKVLITIHLPLVVFEMGAPQPALDTLALFFSQRDKVEAINEHLPALLGQMRTRYPDAVDSFLEDQQAPQEFRLQVLTSESPETVGDLLGLRLFRVAFSILAFGQPVIRDKLIGLFAHAADCKNTRALIDYLIREVINLIYQGEALRQAR